jgi:hypothetical protein
MGNLINPFSFSAGSAGVLPTANKIVEYQTGVGNTEVSGELENWADQSGNDNTLNELGAGRGPSVITNGGPTGTEDSYRFNGSTDTMGAGAFTWNSPATIYLVVKPISWTNNDTLFSGQNSDAYLKQSGATPEIEMYAGSWSTNNKQLALSNWHVIGAVFNATSSKLLIDNDAIATSSIGTNGMDGLRLGAVGGAGGPGNFEITDLVGYTVAHDDATLTSAVKYFQDLYGI